MGKILDAVSILLVHDQKVFAIQRQPFLKTFPGYWAFPGGKVESFDSSSTAPGGIEGRLWAALVREAQEELGVDLRALHAQGGILQAGLFGVAITPEFNPYRFATHFIKLHLRHAPEFMVDRAEAQLAEWFTPQELLARFDQGEMLAVPPVVKVMQVLARDIKAGHAGELNVPHDPSEVPMIESLKGVRQYMPRSHTLPPAERTNCFLLGDAGQPQVLVDPSPCDEQELTRLLHSLRAERIDHILLTHHHPDHHQYATELARRWGASVLMSRDCSQRLLRLRPDYFDGLCCVHLSEGDVVTRWLGQPLRVVAVPGHDEGQLALMPDNRAWFLAGDLFQGVGTVVIGGDEGDMGKYMATLEKVIQLAPRVIFPSHGIGLGSTLVLEKTLAHRREREGQVLSLWQQGRDEDQMLAALYSDIPATLLPYARKNIRAHLAKLRHEGKCES